MGRMLEIRTHEEACMFAMAMREYCDRRTTEFQLLMLQSMERGEGENAERYMKRRNEFTSARAYYVDYPYGKLDKLIQEFENEMRGRGG